MRLHHCINLCRVHILHFVPTLLITTLAHTMEILIELLLQPQDHLKVLFIRQT